MSTLRNDIHTRLDDLEQRFTQYWRDTNEAIKEVQDLLHHTIQENIIVEANLATWVRRIKEVHNVMVPDMLTLTTLTWRVCWIATIAVNALKKVSPSSIMGRKANLPLTGLGQFWDPWGLDPQQRDWDDKGWQGHWAILIHGAASSYDWMYYIQP